MGPVFFSPAVACTYGGRWWFRGGGCGPVVVLADVLADALNPGNPFKINALPELLAVVGPVSGRGRECHGGVGTLPYTDTA